MAGNISIGLQLALSLITNERFTSSVLYNIFPISVWGIPMDWMISFRERGSLSSKSNSVGYRVSFFFLRFLVKR